MDIKKILRITELAVTVTRLTEHDVFVRYYGHIDQLDIDLHEGGWRKCDEGTQLTSSTFSELSGDEIDAIISKLESLLCHTK